MGQAGWSVHRSHFSSDHMSINLAINQVSQIESLCRFLENPDTQRAVDIVVPVCMPRDIGSLGFDVPVFASLGIVGLWAALDAYAERAGLGKQKCGVCGSACLEARYDPTNKLDQKLRRAL